MNTRLWIFLGILAVLGAISCEDKITNEVQMPDEITVITQEQKLTQAGWAAFESGDLNMAKENFLAAIAANSYYADAYNGLGWVAARQDSLPLSRNYFTLGRISAPTDDLFRDASAGRAFVNLALDEYEVAITDVDIAIGWNYYGYYREYVFRHDLSITETDLLLAKAESLFLLEEYQYCYEMLMLIDDTLVIDPSNPESLALAIENLRGLV